MSDNEDPGRHSKRNGLWSRLWRQPRQRFLLGIPIGAVVFLVLGIVLTEGFHKSLALSNTQAFCTSCHEMQAFVYQEFKQSPHYSNVSGVRAKCADCHVPKSFLPKMQRKIQASFNEVPAWITGKIDTREEFEAHRAELAQRVWDRMKAHDSRNCRSCHTYEAMAKESQGRYARRKHSAEYREATGKTCIDCHKGVAHKLPEEM